MTKCYSHERSWQLACQSSNRDAKRKAFRVIAILTFLVFCTYIYGDCIFVFIFFHLSLKPDREKERELSWVVWIIVLNWAIYIDIVDSEDNNKIFFNGVKNRERKKIWIDKSKQQFKRIYNRIYSLLLPIVCHKRPEQNNETRWCFAFKAPQLHILFLIFNNRYFFLDFCRVYLLTKWNKNTFNK